MSRVAFPVLQDCGCYLLVAGKTSRLTFHLTSSYKTWKTIQNDCSTCGFRSYSSRLLMWFFAGNKSRFTFSIFFLFCAKPERRSGTNRKSMQSVLDIVNKDIYISLSRLIRPLSKSGLTRFSQGNVRSNQNLKLLSDNYIANPDRKKSLQKIWFMLPNGKIHCTIRFLPNGRIMTHVTKALSQNLRLNAPFEASGKTYECHGSKFRDASRKSYPSRKKFFLAFAGHVKARGLWPEHSSLSWKIYRILGSKLKLSDSILLMWNCSFEHLLERKWDRSVRSTGD